MYIAQFCQISDHQQEAIIGYCMNADCKDNPQYCSLCILDKHQEHKQDCKTNMQMKKFISEQIPIISKFKKEIDSIFNQKQYHHHFVIKSLTEQQDRLKELELKLTSPNQGFEILPPNILLLREMYQLTIDKMYVDEKNLDTTVEKLIKFSKTVKYLEMENNQVNKQNINQMPLQEQITKEEKESDIYFIDPQQIENQQSNQELPACDYLQKSMYYLNELDQHNNKIIISQAGTIRQDQMLGVLPDKIFFNEIKTFRNFKFCKINQEGYKISEDHKSIKFCADVEKMDRINKFDIIAIFLCEPEIRTGFMAVQNLIIERQFCWIGVCENQLIKTGGLIILQDLENQERKHGFYLIDSRGYSYSNLQREKNNGTNSLRAIENKCIQVEVDRIYHRIVWKLIETQEKFMMDIPRHGKLHLCVGLCSGQIKLQ